MAFVLIVLGYLAACAQDDDTHQALSCGACPQTVLTKDFGANYEQYRQTSGSANTVWDARQAQWRFSNYPQTQPYPIDIRGVTGGTWCGGTVLGTMDTLAEWPIMYDKDLGGGNGCALIFGDNSTPDFTVDGVRFHNVWDALRPRSAAQNFRMQNCWLTYVRDDAIENDHMYSGTVDDCLLDGVFEGFSCRNTDTADHGSEIVTVTDCLVRLQPMSGKPKDSYTPETGHMGFFKWSGLGPRLVLKNNVFMTEQLPWNGTAGLQFPQGSPEKLIQSENNIIVWLGSGPYPGTVQPGFSVTTDRSVWDNARTAWINSHPKVVRFAFDPVSEAGTAVRYVQPAASATPATFGQGTLFNLQGERVIGQQKPPAGIYLQMIGGRQEKVMTTD